MTDYEDYENNLAFPPEGDWADTEPKVNTDRTQSSLDLVDKIEELNKWLDLKSEYIVKLEGNLNIATTALKDIKTLMLQGFGNWERYDKAFRILNDALKIIKNGG